MSFRNKRYLYKVYDSSGNYLATWDDVVDDPQFNVVINGGADVVVTRLARNVLSFGEGDDVNFNNKVEIYCFDDDDPTGILIFSGYIAEYTPTLEGKNEYLEVQIYSYYAELNRYMYEDNATGATEIAHSSVSPADIFQDVFDEFTAAGGTPDYSVSSVDDPGTSVTYTYNTATCKEALNKVIELCPLGWYYRIDPDNIAYLQDSDIGGTTSDHIFNIGRDVVLLEPQKRVNSLVNKIYFRGGEVGGSPFYKKYTRSGSISTYGTYAEKLIDQRVTVEATADTMADSLLDALEAPEIRTRIIVIDNNGSDDGLGYDIESIKVGQTAKVQGFTTQDYTRWDIAEWDVDVWDYSVVNITAIPQQIQRITYKATHIELELSNRLPDINKRIEDINRNLVDSITLDNPTTPTT